MHLDISSRIPDVTRFQIAQYWATVRGMGFVQLMEQEA